MTSKDIIDRHEKFPNATEKLIEAKAFSQYKKAINDLFQFGNIVYVENTEVAMIVIAKRDLEEWKKLTYSDWYMKNKKDL